MDSLAGHLLIAPPSERDPDFAQAVILVIQHSEQQAVGIILNRPARKTIGEALPGKATRECHQYIYAGGPVPGPHMAIHTCRSLSELTILPGVYYSVQKKRLEQIFKRADQRFKLFENHAGWGPGQLERWIEVGRWEVQPATAEDIFDPGTGLWARVSRQSHESRLM